ncbi:M56 family metallopeptidase, partial [Pontibacter sp. HJ8]
VLQQESFFAMNRFYLMACLVLAFALPFVSLPPLVSHQGYLSNILQQGGVTEATPSLTTVIPDPTETAAGIATAEQPETPVVSQNMQAEAGEKAQVGEEQPVTGQGSWVFWLVMLYLFGVAVFSLSLFFQAGNILYKALTSTDKIQDGDCVIVNTASKQAPCSFFRYIFIHPDDYDYETYEQIIAHEKIHVRQVHTLDLIIAELAVILLWFNPFIWFFRKEVEKNNEYQTDATLLEEEQVNKRQYQLNLLQIAVPNKPLSITTNYNQSLLKQRIVMMNARKSNAHAYWKYTFLAPLLFGALLLLNEPATSQNISIPGTVPAPDFASAAPVTPVPDPGVPPSPAVPPSPTAPDVPMEDKTGKTGMTEQTGKNKPARKKGMSINIQGADTDISQGFWYSHQDAGDYCIEFKGSRNSSTWNISKCFNKGLFQKKGNEVFVLVRETGTLQLNGALDADVSQGKYTFTEDTGFRKYLADNNITGSNKNFMFHLFLSDVDKKYVAFL